eukprot:COSAG01_NODE_20341_length_958_cov_10.598865_2_plen_81_part_00
MALAPGSLPLFRQLQFMGGCAFNVLMAAGSLVSVIVYEHLGYAAPFYVRASTLLRSIATVELMAGCPSRAAGMAGAGAVL